MKIKGGKKQLSYSHLPITSVTLLDLVTCQYLPIGTTVIFKCVVRLQVKLTGAYKLFIYALI